MFKKFMGKVIKNHFWYSFTTSGKKEDHTLTTSQFFRIFLGDYVTSYLVVIK